MTEKPVNGSASLAAFQQIRAAFRLAGEAYIAAMRPAMAALKPLAEWAERHPEELARWQAEREAEEQLGSCHCLCGTHARQASGVCVSVAEPGLTAHYDSPTVGPTDVPLCRPCYQARQLVSA